MRSTSRLAPRASRGSWRGRPPSSCPCRGTSCARAMASSRRPQRLDLRSARRSPRSVRRQVCGSLKTWDHNKEQQGEGEWGRRGGRNMGIWGSVQKLKLQVGFFVWLLSEFVSCWVVFKGFNLETNEKPPSFGDKPMVRLNENQKAASDSEGVAHFHCLGGPRFRSQYHFGQVSGAPQPHRAPNYQTTRFQTTPIIMVVVGKQFTFLLIVVWCT